MKNLIKIQALIEDIEKTTGLHYRSKFDYIDDKNLIVEAFCWEQMALYKSLFTRMKDVLTYVTSNNKLQFIDYSEE